MRLVFLTNVFPNPIAPTKGTFNLELAKALAASCELTMVVPVAWTDQIRGRRLSSVQHLLSTPRETRVSGIRTFYPTYWYSPGIGRSHYHTWMRWSLSSTLRRIEQDSLPDAVLSYWAHPDGAVATEWANRHRFPSWMMVGGSDVLLLGKDAKRGLVIRQALEAAEGIIAVSQNIARELTCQGLPPDKVSVVRRGVDFDRFHPRDRAQARDELGLDHSAALLVWVGRMVSVKGLERLLDAAAEAKRLGADFQLALVGDGPLRPSLQARATRLGLADNTRFVGNVPHEQLASWYQAADWTILTSFSEGIPNVLLESHACGTPFLATSVGGVPEIAIDGVDRLVASNDAQALADAIADVTRSKCEISAEALSESVGSLTSASDRVLELIRGSLTPAAPSGVTAIAGNRV